MLYVQIGNAQIRKKYFYDTTYNIYRVDRTAFDGLEAMFGRMSRVQPRNTILGNSIGQGCQIFQMLRAKITRFFCCVPLNYEKCYKTIPTNILHPSRPS